MFDNCRFITYLVDRQIGVKNFIRVVILDPRTKGHVIQRMRNSLAYTTACTTVYKPWPRFVRCLTVWTVVSCSNNFSIKLGSGCWATAAPQKLCGPRTPLPYRVLCTLNSVTATEIVLCDVLCFLSHKFVNTSIKVLKSILMDFYSSEDIASAKKHLLDDISVV